MIPCAQSSSMPDRDDSARGAPSDERLSRRAAAGALSAELGHDLQGPLNLFRLMTERLENGHAPDAEDASLLREELENLSRMSARLRELARQSLQRAEHEPRQLVELALSLSPSLAATELELDVASVEAEGALIDCDAALVARAVRELLDNALEARKQRAGVRWEATEPPALCVWDDGAGFALEPGQAARFGASTRAGAAGLGLTLALRVARGHGFRLDFVHNQGRTEARLVFLAPAGGERATKGPG